MLRLNDSPRGFLRPQRARPQSASLPPAGCLGALAPELARAHPGLRVTVFDLPEAAEHVACLRSTGRRTEQVRFVPGKGSWAVARGSALGPPHAPGTRNVSLHACVCVCACACGALAPVCAVGVLCVPRIGPSTPGTATSAHAQVPQRKRRRSHIASARLPRPLNRAQAVCNS